MSKPRSVPSSPWTNARVVAGDLGVCLAWGMPDNGTSLAEIALVVPEGDPDPADFLDAMLSPADQDRVLRGVA